MTGEDDKIIRPAFGAPQSYDPKADTRILPSDLAPQSPNVDGATVVSRRELVEIRGRLLTIMIEAHTLESWIGRILGEDDNGDAG